MLGLSRGYLIGGRSLFDPPLDLSTVEGRREQAVRLAVAIEVLPRDPATDFKLHKIMLILRERERKRPLQGDAEPIVVQNLDFHLRELLAKATTETVANENRTPVAPVSATFRETG
jgi:hypothetical protein